MKDNHSRHAVGALVRLELNSRFAGVRLNSFGGILKALFGLGAIVLIYYLYVTIAESIILSFYVYNRESLFLKLFVSLIGFVMALGGISSIVKSLFFSGDNELLIRFPVKVMDVFTAKVLVQGVITFIYLVATYVGLWRSNQTNFKLLYHDSGRHHFELRSCVWRIHFVCYSVYAHKDAG